MSEFQNRLHGSEMEWSFMVSHPDHQVQEVLETNELIKPFAIGLEQIGVQATRGDQSKYLANGARMYVDVRERLEYATPEDISYEGAVANEIAGDIIMKAVADVAAHKMRMPVSLTKRVIDDKGVGCGYHVSYCVPAEKLDIDYDSLELFGIFAATRSPLFGAGALRRNGSFIFGQKAETNNMDYSIGTVSEKPVINLRDESLSDERFVRFHDVSSDPNISPWSLRVGRAAGSMVLRLIEENVEMPLLRFEAPLFAVSRAVTQDTEFRQRYDLASGQQLSALDVQEQFIAAAKRLDASKSLPAEEQWALAEWEQAVIDLKRGASIDKLAKRIDWAAKLKILMRSQERHGHGWDSEAMRYKDRQYSEIAYQGLASTLRETLFADYMPPESLIQERIYNAPPTRASVRAQFIAKTNAEGYGDVVDVDWDKLHVYRRVNDNYFSHKIVLGDPYDTDLSPVEKQLQHLRTIKRFDV